MSDLPNGNPPGQNNLDAGVERYVDQKNDPSAGTPKTDPKEQEAMAKGEVFKTEDKPAPEPVENDPSDNPAQVKEQSKEEPKQEPATDMDKKRPNR